MVEDSVVMATTAVLFMISSSSNVRRHLINFRNPLLVQWTFSEHVIWAVATYSIFTSKLRKLQGTDVRVFNGNAAVRTEDTSSKLEKLTGVTVFKEMGKASENRADYI